MRTTAPRTAVAAFLLALLATLLPATPVQAQTVEKYQNQARAVTNNKRADHDLVKLRKGACVQRFARRHARRMANKEKMYHQDLGPIMSECNLSLVGENVAYGYPTGRAVVRAWMRSEGHRANILHRKFRILGLAMRKSDDGTPYAVQVFGRK